MTPEQRKANILKKISNYQGDNGIGDANTRAGQFSNVPLAGVTVPGETQDSILNGVFNPLADLIQLRSKEIVANGSGDFEKEELQVNKLIENHTDLRKAMEKAVTQLTTEQEFREYDKLQKQNQSTPRMTELADQINKKIARIAHIAEAVVADVVSKKSTLDDTALAKNFEELHGSEFNYQAGQQLVNAESDPKQQGEEYLSQLTQWKTGGKDQELDDLVDAIKTTAKASFNKMIESDDSPVVKLKRMAGIQASSTELLSLIADIQNIRNQYESAKIQGQAAGNQSMTRTPEDRQADVHITFLEDKLKKTLEMYGSNIDTGIDSEMQKTVYKSLLASLKGVVSSIQEQAHRVNNQTAQTEQTQRIGYAAQSESTKELTSPSLFARFTAVTAKFFYKKPTAHTIPVISPLQDVLKSISSKYSDEIATAAKPSVAEINKATAKVNKKEIALGITSAPEVTLPTQSVRFPRGRM